MAKRKRNTLYGKQKPTYKLVEKYTESLGDICGDLISNYGYKPFEWQQALYNDMLALNDDGEFIHMVIGVLLPRQNGKTLCIIALIIFFLVAYLEYTDKKQFNILYSAHEVRTSRSTFTELVAFFDNKEEYPELYELTHWGSESGIRKANGQECIECRWTNNGVKYKTRVEFCARSKRAARGLGKNFIILDEAQEVTSEQTAAMLPTLAASKIRQQLVYLGTPNYPGCPGDKFNDLRIKVHNSKPKGTLWWEYSVKEIGDITDKKRWALTNPSLGYLIREDYIETVELTGMSEDEFARERLGYVHNEEELFDFPIDKQDWNMCLTNNPMQDGITCFSCKFDLSGRHAAIVACMKKDGEFYIELVGVYSSNNGMQQIVDFFTNMNTKPAQIIIDGRGTSYDLQQRLQQNKIRKSAIIVARTVDLTNACSMFANSVAAHEIMFYGQQEQLTQAATTCTRRLVGKEGSWGFADSDTGHAFIVESAALAYLACRTTKRNPKRKGRIG